MSFRDAINAIPFQPRTQNGGGFLPPILRAQGHILYLLGCMADENVAVTPEDAVAELTAARDHFHARCDAAAALSTNTLALSDSLEEALTFAVNEFPDWPEADRVNNIRDLANRTLAFAAALDRELVGLAGSDPGSSL